MTAYVVAILALAGALVAIFPRLVENTAAVVPDRWQHQVGQQTIDQLASLFSKKKGESRFCSDPFGSTLLSPLMVRLSKTAEEAAAYKLHIVNAKTVNAFAAPGGNIVIFKGLIDAAQSPDEVAGVLAHEMGHIIENHPVEFAVRQLGFKLLTTLLIGRDGTALGIGQQLITLNYSRDAEREADAIAVERLRAANLRTDGLAKFLERLADKESNLPEIFKYLSTHPASSDRASSVRQNPSGERPAMTETIFGRR